MIGAVTTTSLRFAQHLVSESYSFGPHNEFVMWIADTPELKAKSLDLIRRMYAARGYDNSRSRGTDEFDSGADSVTFLVTAKGEAAATLRVIPDSKIALPLDAIFGDSADRLRNNGRHLCEIGAMAVDDSHARAAMAMLMELFRLAWWTARHMMGATDMLASVMAHHVQFYRRLLLFDEAGGTARTSPRTGCAVSFCRLDLHSAEQRYHDRYVKCKGGRNLYHFFCEDPRTPELMTWLRRSLESRSELEQRTVRMNRRRETCSTSTQPLRAMSA